MVPDYRAVILTLKPNRYFRLNTLVGDLNQINFVADLLSHFPIEDVSGNCDLGHVFKGLSKNNIIVHETIRFVRGLENVVALEGPEGTKIVSCLVMRGHPCSGEH